MQSNSPKYANKSTIATTGDKIRQYLALHKQRKRLNKLINKQLELTRHQARRAK